MVKSIAKFPRPEDRNVYRPSCRVNWALFIPGVALTLVVAVLMAVALAFLGTWGWHIILIAPLLLIAPAAFALVGAVRFGHCRNPKLAFLIGVVVGLIVGVGHYQAELAIILKDPKALARMELLPRYVKWQMQNQVITEVGHDKPKNKNGPDVVGIIFNWFFLGMEVLLCVGAGAAAGGLMATRIYDESRRCWAVPGKGEFHLSTGWVLANALANRTPEGIEAALAQTQFAKADGYSKIEVYRTSLFNDFGDWEDVYYLTVTQYGPKDKSGVQAQTVLITGWELYPDEAEIVTKHVCPAAPSTT